MIRRLRGPVAPGAPLLLFVSLLLLPPGVVSFRGLDEVNFPDAESDTRTGQNHWRYGDLGDDEDFAADEASGDDIGSTETGSGTEELSPATPPSLLTPTGIDLSLAEPQLAGMSVPEQEPFLIYYRALVNFTQSIDYTPDLDNVSSPEFTELSEAVVDTLESEYHKIPGEQMVSVVYVKIIDRDTFVELDVGSEGNSNDAEIRQVLFSVIDSGSIASYIISTQGFQFRRLGSAQTLPSPVVTEPPVTPSVRPCRDDEFTCASGDCVPAEYRCDQRHDCRDMSDELGCEGEPSVTESEEPRTTTLGPRPGPVSTARPATTSASPVITTTAFKHVTPKPPPDFEARQCRRDEARCPNGHCIPRDYLCDGEKDCKDGSDEMRCGTPSPCEPNEFKCKNGRCALKLWRCDGDNDCGDGSDELNCPTKGPSDTCAPDQFVCVQARTCIPASYQCDDEADCPDRSDEVGCNPPQVITPPEESIMASRGETVRFTCVAIGVPTPIITWRLNWGHIPTSNRVSMTSENGHGTLIIRDIKEADQGAYTCEAINAKGMVFGIPDGVLVLKPHRGPCPEGSFYVESSSRCIPCFCFGVTKVCQQTGHYRNQIRLRFDVPEDFKGVNITVPSHVGIPPLSSNQLQIDTSVEEFQLVDLSRRFLSIDSFWTLPGQFLGNKVDSYGGSLSFKVRYGLTRGQSEPVRKPDVILVGNGRKLIYRVQTSTQPSIVNQRKVQFTEENWQHESGAPVTREDLLMTLQNLEGIMIQTVYDNKMASVGISDIVMDTTSVEYTQLGPAVGVEECRCPGGYAGLSCEVCAAQFERVPGGPFLGTCSGCNCNGHASSCDPVSGYCLNCQHNTEGPQCNKCKAGFFGDPTRGVPDACRPCPCPHTDPRRRFSDTCFMDVDGQPTCDSCAPGYTGRRCERCAEGYDGRPMQPGGRCEPVGNVCDVKGALSTSDGSCVCKAHVEGNFCSECKSGTFYLSEKNPDGCLKCFCMGVTRQCSSSFWNRDQVSSTYDSHDRALFTISNAGSTRTLSEGIRVTGPSELTFSNFLNVPQDVYFWVLPDRFKGDKVTSYGGELRYTITFEAPAGSQPLYNQPDVVLQGNGIFLEHLSNTRTAPGFPITITVPFRERAWRRADGQDATREHLLMALADIDLLMIRSSYAERMVETRISNIHMDVAVPFPTDRQRAVEVEQCVCPPGYNGPSCQDCDTGYTRSTSGLYLGTCERCQCGGHSSECDRETGECVNCQHNTEGTKCEKCKSGFYGDPTRGTTGDCQPCPCQGTSAQYFGTCFLDRDGHPTCDSCPVGYAGRQCERCAPGYRGDPARGQPCTADGSSSCPCDLRGSVSDKCDSRRQCECKPNVEGSSCGTCRPQYFHLSTENPEGCLPCFCMGVTQQCSSSTYHRELISTPFLPGNFQNFALINRQHSSRITSGFTVEMSTHGPQLTHGSFDQLGQESYYWQLPEGYQGDKREMYFARMRRAHKNDSSLSEEELRKKVASGQMEESPATRTRPRRQAKMDEKQKQVDSEIWNLLSGFSSASLPKASPPSTTHNESQGTPIPPPASYVGPPGAWSELPPPIRERPITQSGANTRSFPEAGPPGHARKQHASHEAPSGDSPLRSQAQDSTNFLFPQTTRLRGSEKFSLVYKGFSLLPEGVFYWQLPKAFLGDKVASYGGKLRYTLTYNAGVRGSALPDADVQITGNDITLVAYQPEIRPRESKTFEIVFRERFWKRPDGQPATREHLMMALADLDEILIRASYSTDMLSSGITGVSMETAGPSYTNLPQALEVEECRCPPGYQGLSCQDCAPGYTRTGGGLYLGHCEPCYCNGHSDSCHPETGACSNCLHNTVGESCDQCAPGFYGDASAGTPEDCQPCACPLTNPENQFSRTCEILGTSGYRCTACQPGYTGQYCDQCASGYTGNPNIHGQKCVPEDSRSKLVVRIHPQKATVTPGGDITLRCHVTGNAPYYFYWSREDGRPIPASAKPLGEGENLHFSRVQPTDSGVYICTCRSPESVNTSKAEILVSAAPSKPITVTVEEQRVQTVRPGSDVTFICTAKSKSPAYTLVWTRQHNRKLPDRAMDFNGILTIRRVQPEDAGIYVCTGSNMYDMDEGNATLYVQAGTTTSPNAAAEPRQLTVQRGQSAEFRCTATGNPTPTVEWTGGPNGGLSSRAIVQGGILRFQSVEPSDEGQYTCRVQNSVGQHFARVNLRVHSGSLPEVQVSPERTEVREGDTVRLYCRAGGTPTATISWKKEGGDLPSQALSTFGFLHFRSSSWEAIKRRAQELQARTERTDISTLVIPSISAADGGTYLCVGTSSAGYSQARIEVIVIRVPVHGPALRIEPSSDTIIEGQSVELNCASPNPYVTVTWHRGGGQPLSPNHQAYGSRLRILQASAADSGEYICRVTNGGSTQQASIVITITRSSASGNVPALRIEPSSDRLVEGQTLELNCLFPNYPNAVVTWDRAGYTLSPNHQVSGSRLRILKASVADSGEYICRVTTGSLTQEASILVTITRASGSALPSGNGPAVRIESSSGPAVEGQTLDLNCMVAGQPNAVVTWERTGRPLSPNHQVLGSRLRIHQASVADSGEYICRTTTAGTTRQASIMVTITRRTSSSHSSLITPTINIESTSDSIAEGRTVVLNCVIEGRPHEEVTWYRPDQPLAPNHQVSGSRLQIIHASPKDSGEYICRIHSGSGVQMASIMVSIEGSSLNTGLQAPIRIESSSEAAELGQTIDLNCLADGRPGAVVTWHRLGGLPLASNHQVSGSRMRILQASPTDSGIYICRVSTSSGSQEASITINVQSSVQVPNQFPHPILIEKSADAVSEGQTLELNCIVVGQPQAPVSWHRTGAPFSSNHQISGSHLRIVQASTADSGQYVCRHDTGTGVQQASMSVSILSGAASSYRLQSPVISIDPHSATVQRGQNATFKCRIHDGAKPIRVTWQMRHNQPMEDNVHISPNGSIITIVGAHHKNQGSYRCMASNAYGMVHSSVNLVVEGRPSVSVIPQGKIRVKVGEPINVECMGIGDPRPIVSWRRTGARENLKQYKLGSLDGTAVLQIPSAKPADSGSYTCVSLNPFGSTQVQVEVLVEGHVESPEAPLLVLADKPLHVVVAGGQASLNCTASGNPTPTITWSKLRAPLPWQHQVINNTLIIPNVAQQDSGQYICNASNAKGFAEIYVTLDVEIPTYATTFPHETSVSTGESIKIQCLSHGTHPLKFQWSKVDGTLPDQASSRDGVLHIDRASASDSGTYRCVASNKVGSSEAFAQVTVSGKGVETGRPTASIIPRGPIRVKVGEPINVECMGIGDPRPIVSWRRTGARENLKQYKLGSLDGTAVLQIPSAKPADSGSYTCVAHNPLGSTQVQVEVLVEGHVESPEAPLLVLADKPLHVVVAGGQASLNCTASGNPTPTITWSKLRAPLPWQHQVINNTLIIPNVAQQDSGQYICNASNANGFAEIYVTLDVEIPTYATTFPHETSVSTGESIKIQCLSHGTHPLKFQWSKVDGTLPDQASSRDGVLHIDRASASDSGTYRCVASNKVGSSEAFAQVTVSGKGVETGRPTASIIPRGPIRVKVGHPIYLECMGKGDPRPVVSWRRTGTRQNLKPQQLVPLDSNAVLQILSARPEDSGSYTCTAQNPSGSTQVHVEVHVEGHVINPGAPKVTADQPLHVVVTGGRATLSCRAVGNPAPKITWSKLRAPLPWQHEVVNDTLIIPKAALQDSGQYICNATNAEGYSEVFITLDVETPPYATTLPDEVSVSVGEVVQIQCLAHGTSPLKFQWGKVNGSLPDRATVRDSTLHINLAKATDAGTYRCVVSNKVGSSEAFAQVSILAPFAVRVSPLIDTKPISGTAEFTCTAIGDPQARIQWFKDGGQLPAGHQVQGGMLRIPNLEFGHEGTYTCRISSRFGQAQESVKLVLQALPKVRINIRTSVQTVLAGNSVEFECLALGDPRAKVTWSKVGSRLPSDAVISGGTLRIEQVKQSDAGQYRCTVANDVGEVQSHVILHVQSVPQIAAQPEMKEITAGSTAVFPCLASGFPVPDITWSKLEGELPIDHQMENNVLTIPSVKPEDAGTYVCTAANRQGRVTAFSMLKVRERVVPYFTGQPQSYLTLPSIKDAHKKLEIKITFRPDTADGMLVYSGQKKSNGADFVSFGLVGGRPEFRFDAGSGMATIRYPTPISLGEFHTVTLYRNLTQGSLVVDKHVPVNGTSQGKFQGLDLNEELFLGGYPNYDFISKTGLSSGFVGCIRQLVIQEEEVIFKDLDLSARGVSNCPTCRDRPCKNRGTCHDSESSSYVCICPTGFTGSNCEHSQALHCHPEACGPDATCINRADGQGYTCRCHLGKSGDKCMDGVMVNTPTFNGDTSYISYPPLTNIHNELRVDLEFKPISSDGLLFFSGGKAAPVEDFVSIAMVGGYLEFRYELGSGLAILRSLEPLTLGQWHKATAERVNKDGTLIVDNSDPVKRSSPGKSQGLNLKTLMYLGGIDGSVELPSAINISRHFQGCIGEVSINGKKVDISYSFIESLAIGQCYDNSPCDRMPCLHGGRCLPTGEYEYQCLCLDGFKGDRCEMHEDHCQIHNPCLNGGICKDNRCHCPSGFSGTICEHDAPGLYGSYFSDDSYIALPKHVFPRSRPDAPETIELEVRTTSSDGVILWQGMVSHSSENHLLGTNQEENEQGKGKDFISMGLKDGHLLFSYQLGSGEANIRSEDPVNDGEWHRIVAVREGKLGSIQIDGEDSVSGASPGRNIMVNTKGSVYLGRAPNVKTLTGGKFSSGISGCIKNLVILNARPSQQFQQPIDLKHHAEAGHNTKECPS